MQFLLRQFNWCRMSNDSFVRSLLNDFVAVICLQHLFFAEDRQGEQPVSLGGFFGVIFFPLDRCTWPIRLRRFLFLLYASTGRSENAGAISLCVWSICQCLFMILWTGGSSRLNAVVKGVRLLGGLGLSASNASRGISSAFLNCFLVSSLGYPLLCSFCSMSCIAFTASLGFEQIFLARKNWPNRMFCICLSGW